MDFPTPRFALDAIQHRLEHPILGYTEVPDRLVDAVVAWAHRKFEWELDPDWILWISAVVSGMSIAVRTVGERGDGCLVFLPSYPPFLDMPPDNDRELITSNLRLRDGSWVMDMDDVAEKCRSVSSLLLCNPQNPTGRVYSRQELLELSEVCLKTETTLISDEIHWGLILDENKRHIPVASISPEIAANVITIVSHTKSYNLAGLQSAIAIIPDKRLRDTFENATRGLMTSGSPLSYAGAIAAYEDNSSWLADLASYLRSNRELLESTVNKHDALQMTHVEGTHLAWIDARALPVANPKRFFEAFGLGLNDGEDFGTPGFVRFNFAVPRSLLMQGIERLEKAMAQF